MSSVNNVPDNYGKGTGYGSVYSPYDLFCSSNSAQTQNYDGTHAGSTFTASKGTSGYSSYTFTVDFTYSIGYVVYTDCSPHSTTNPEASAYVSFGGAVYDNTWGWSALNNTLYNPFILDTSGLTLSSCTWNSGGGFYYRGWIGTSSTSYSFQVSVSLHHGDSVTPRGLWEVLTDSQCTNAANSGDSATSGIYWDTQSGVISNGYIQISSISIS